MASPAQDGYEFCHVGCHGDFPCNSFPTDRMVKPQPERVQCLAPERFQSLLRTLIQSEPAPSIDRIARQGEAQMLKMDANLVGSPGFQTALDPGVTRQMFDHVNVGDCRPTS